jgi:hypothetical protein
VQIALSPLIQASSSCLLLMLRNNALRCTVTELL